MAVFGVPGIKEDKAIALRAIDICFWSGFAQCNGPRFYSKTKGNSPEMGVQKWVKNGSKMRVFEGPGLSKIRSFGWLFL